MAPTHSGMARDPLHDSHNFTPKRATRQLRRRGDVAALTQLRIIEAEAKASRADAEAAALKVTVSAQAATVSAQAATISAQAATISAQAAELAAADERQEMATELLSLHAERDRQAAELAAMRSALAAASAQAVQVTAVLVEAEERGQAHALDAKAARATAAEAESEAAAAHGERRRLARELAVVRDAREADQLAAKRERAALQGQLDRAKASCQALSGGFKEASEQVRLLQAQLAPPGERVVQQVLEVAATAYAASAAATAVAAIPLGMAAAAAGGLIWRGAVGLVSLLRGGEARGAAGLTAASLRSSSASSERPLLHSDSWGSQAGSQEDEVRCTIVLGGGAAKLACLAASDDGERAGDNV